MSYSSEVLADTPVAYFRLAEPSGTTLTDASAQAHNGTYVNGTTFGVTGPITSDVSDKAITLASASSQYGTCTLIAAYNVADLFTFEGWFKSTTLASQTIVSLSTGAGQLRLNGSGQLEMLKCNTAPVGGTTTVYTDGNWHHAVWTKNAATNHLYVDGADVTPSVSAQTMVNPTGALYVGNRSGTIAELFNGSLDEVAIYATELSAGRVAAHYAAAAGAAALKTLALMGVGG